MATKKKDDKKQTEANNIRQELADDADERKAYIRMALNDLPDADKVRNEKVLAKTREIIKDTFRGDLNLKNATTIANAIIYNTLANTWLALKQSGHPLPLLWDQN